MQRFVATHSVMQLLERIVSHALLTAKTIFVVSFSKKGNKCKKVKTNFLKGVCGDGNCDTNEGCSSCFVDCGPCGMSITPSIISLPFCFRFGFCFRFRFRFRCLLLFLFCFRFSFNFYVTFYKINPHVPQTATIMVRA